MSDNRRSEKDAVTVGMIRSRMLKQLESQITDLNRLIRQGYNQRQEAEAFLAGPIGETLTLSMGVQQ
jgi:hypothetical protein